MAEVDAGEAREQARQVLEGDRYHATDVPRPFQGALRWLGERIEDVVGPVGEALATPLGLGVALVVVGGLTVVAATRAVRRRTRRAEAHESRRRRVARPDPVAMEAEADAAEAAGVLDVAIRLRFRAGIVRLEQAGAVARGDDATTGMLVREVPSATLRELASTFDEVAYGGRAPTAAEASRARSGWPVVLADADALAGGRA